MIFENDFMPNPEIQATSYQRITNAGQTEHLESFVQNRHTYRNTHRYRDRDTKSVTDARHTGTLTKMHMDMQSVTDTQKDFMHNPNI